MENKKYESPRFEFQEMKLMETVADTCWGYKYGWYDVDGDKIHDADEAEIKLDDWGSCNAVAVGLPDYLKKHFGITVNGDDVKENSHSPIVRPITS